MKIEFNNGIIKAMNQSIKNVTEEYKEKVPECNKIEYKNIELDSKTRKWGSISVEGNKTTIDISDKFITDVIKLIEKLATRFAPVITMGYSLYQMYKGYINETIAIAKPLINKYTSEMEYTVTRLNGVGIEFGCCVLERVKGDKVWKESKYDFITYTDDIDTTDYDEIKAIGKVAYRTAINTLNKAENESVVYTDYDKALEACKKLKDGRFDKMNDDD